MNILSSLWNSLYSVSESCQSVPVVGADYESGVFGVKAVDRPSSDLLTGQCSGLSRKSAKVRSCIAIDECESSDDDNEDFKDCPGENCDGDYLLASSSCEEYFDASDMCTDYKICVTPSGDRGLSSVLYSSEGEIHHSKSESEAKSNTGESKMRLPLPVSAEAEGRIQPSVSHEVVEQIGEEDGGEWQQVIGKKKNKRKKKAKISRILPRVNHSEPQSPAGGEVVYCRVNRGSCLIRKPITGETELTDLLRHKKNNDQPFDEERCFEQIKQITRNDFIEFVGNLKHYNNQTGYEKFFKLMETRLNSLKEKQNERNNVPFLFRVFLKLLSEHSLSVPLLESILCIILVVEKRANGFLKGFGNNYFDALYALMCPGKDSIALDYLAESLAEVYENKGLDQLGWRTADVRGRCKMFMALSRLFLAIGKKDIKKQVLIKLLMKEINESWLNENICEVLRRIKRAPAGNDKIAASVDLSYVCETCFQWLDVKFYCFDLANKVDFLNCYFGTRETVWEVLPHCDVSQVGRLRGVILRYDLRFAHNFARYFGYENAIEKLDKIITDWSGKAGESELIRLKLTLITVRLLYIEDMLTPKNKNDFFECWEKSSLEIEQALIECEGYLNKGGGAVFNSEFFVDIFRYKLILKRSAFERLACHVEKTTLLSAREKINKHSVLLEPMFNEKSEILARDSLNENAVLELAKWYDLAGYYDKATSLLTDMDFKVESLRRRKIRLLQQFGLYQIAIEELKCFKALIPDNTESNRQKRYDIDCDIAMNLLNLYEEKQADQDDLKRAFLLVCKILNENPNYDRHRAVLLHLSTAMVNNVEFSKIKPFLPGYLSRSGCWEDVCSKLSLEHKSGLSGDDVVTKASKAIRRYGTCLDTGKMAFNF